MRILVVDDDFLAAEMTVAVLEDGGLEAATVENAQAALDLLSADPDFDAVVSDLNMPGLSGLDLFRSLQEKGNSLPFILLSGDDPEDLKRQEPGLAACVAKDINFETTLMNAVADALLPPAARPPHNSQDQ
jgi:CheY-like chemotaxis protein